MDLGERAGLEQLVVEGKLRAPRPRSDTFSRAALIDRAVASAAHVVTVVAPAGYGKSTLLAEWIAAENRRTAWVHLDALDNDPIALLTVLTSACAPLLAESEQLVARVAHGATEPLARGMPLLAAAMRNAPEPFVLFIDDAHEVASDACDDLLDVILASVPDGSAIVVSSRRRPPYVARQRIAGSAFEIGVNELRLSVDGARHIADAAGATASDRELHDWVERCDGWPTGLFLCALVARDGRPLHGGDHRIADYLYRECLAGLPDGTRDFVLRSSVLTELSADVCNGVLEIADAARRLDELDELNLFLIPVDEHRGRYRYHALFRQFLHEQLEITRPGLRGVLHGRAADWHLSRGSVVEAIEHAFEADDSMRAAGLIARFGQAIYQRGQVALLDRWFERLGEPLLEQAPWATVIATWLSLLQGSVPDAIRWTALLERIEVIPARPDAIALESQRAVLRAVMRVGTVEEGLADAVFAAVSEAPTSPWRALAVHVHGLMLAIAGDSTASRRAHEQAVGLARELGNTGALLLSESHLAELDIVAGDWGAAERHVRSAIAVVADNHMEGYAVRALPYALEARIALHRGDVVGTDRALGRAMVSRERATYLLPTLAVQARLHMAHVWLGIGDRKAAAALVEEIDEIVARRPQLGVLLDDIEALRGRVRHELDVGTVPLTPAELRVIPYLQTHLTLAQIGERLAVSRNTVNSQVASIYRKLGTKTRGEAVEEALRRGLLGR